jgi:aryl-alcohol dehydrogenase-like predicted oxidoreductase
MSRSHVACHDARRAGRTVSRPRVLRRRAEHDPAREAGRGGALLKLTICRHYEHELNVLTAEEGALAAAEETGLASLNRTPLAMGLLTGKYTPANRPPEDDVRRDAPWWTFFDDGAMEGWLERIATVREHLTFDGRTLAQGALGWVWARSEATLPLPGFRTVEQVEDNARAAAFGPLPPDCMAAIRGAPAYNGT